MTIVRWVHGDFTIISLFRTFVLIVTNNSGWHLAMGLSYVGAFFCALFFSASYLDVCHIDRPPGVHIMYYCSRRHGILSASCCVHVELYYVV